MRNVAIHKISAFAQGRENYNGWEYWYILRDEKLISINDLRYDYEAKYIKGKQSKSLEIEFEPKPVISNNETFLDYGSNDL
jgi:hypothetical protein